MCPNRGDRDLEQFGGHGTDTFLRHDYATSCSVLSCNVTQGILANHNKEYK